MKIKCFIFILLQTLLNTVYSQDLTCDCSKVFTELCQKLEVNYLGLVYLRQEKGDEWYSQLKGAFNENARSVAPNNCAAFLQKFLRNLDDGHVFVFERPSYGEAELLSLKSQIISEKLNEKELEAELLQQSSSTPDPFIGKWGDGVNEYTVVKRGNEYLAYIKNSSEPSVVKGTLKARFQFLDGRFEGTYYSLTYRPRYAVGQMYKEGTLFAVDGGIYWVKWSSAYQRELSMINTENVTLPTITKLDEKTTLFSIPSFNVDRKLFDKILKENEKVLKTTSHLIIDIRGNTGGNALYFSFLGIYADKHIPESQGFVLASEDTKAYYEEQAKYSRKIYEPVINGISNNLGKVIDGPLYPVKKVSRINSQIETVSILTDHGCMSAAESFILHSKQVSDKVKTFGEPTGGVIDYTSVHVIKLTSSESQNIYFGYPTSTLNKYAPGGGYNRTGIVPDVTIPANEEDKIYWIMKYVNTRN
ncbi:MAG: hypothetical protein HOP30_00010 [Cyclobacteriaceae bacterium]|nr:hypothetical protein [Cyclobacteriaceae bacterium]